VGDGCTSQGRATRIQRKTNVINDFQSFSALSSVCPSLSLSLSLSLFDSFYDERFLFSKKNLFMTFYFIDLISQLCIFMVFAFAMLKVQMVPSRTSKLSQDWFDFSHLKFEWDLRDESFVLDSCKIF